MGVSTCIHVCRGRGVCFENRRDTIREVREEREREREAGREGEREGGREKPVSHVPFSYR